MSLSLPHFALTFLDLNSPELPKVNIFVEFSSCLLIEMLGESQKKKKKSRKPCLLFYANVKHMQSGR